ncbi:MAG: DUF885 domain-containing protein, partial [Actinomycetota bacterium]|nr:DUF885 domain-containing protein [Actinomycetota bacterium]
METSKPTRAQTAIDAVADAYTDKLIELDPGFGTMLGLPGHESEYRDYSPAGLEAMAAAAAAALDGLDAETPQDEVDRVTLHAMRERLGLLLELHATGWDLAELNNIASPAQDIRAIFDLMPTDTAEHWEHIAGRLGHVPAAVQGYLASLRAGRERGLVAAKRQVTNVIEQAERHAAADGFFATLAASAGLGRGAADDGGLPEGGG